MTTGHSYLFLPQKEIKMNMWKGSLVGLLWVLLVFGANAQSPVKSNARTQAVYFPANYVPGKGSIKVLSWNAENFVDGFDDPYINNERENNPPAEMAEKEEILIRAFKSLNPDVVVLQEFETAKYLEALSRAKFPELGYVYFAEAPSLNWFQNVVIMSKIPLGVMHSYGNVFTHVPGITDRDGKPETQNLVNNRMWTVEVLVNADFNFLLTGVHLKAGRSDRDVAMRKGQIEFLKGQFRRFTREDKKVPMLMVGDFNCTPESEEFALLNKDKKKYRWIDPIADPAIFSHPADNPRWRIDHILMNQSMEKFIVPGSVKVLENLFDKESMRKASDHLPMVVEINPAR